MSADFDTSKTCRKKIDRLLKVHSCLKAEDDEDDREEIIDALFFNLDRFNRTNPADSTFDFGLDQHDMEQSKSGTIFRGIADAISGGKGKVSNFYHKQLKKRYWLDGIERPGRDLFCWTYLHYQITVITKVSKQGPGITEIYSLIMTIIDLDKKPPRVDSDESGDETEDDNDPLKARKGLRTFFILQSLHDRIKKLEVSCGLQPTAFQRRLE